MADKHIEKEIADYIAGAKWAVFATVKDGNIPALRTIGGFANDGLNIYFSTGKETDKVKQIEKNGNVAVFFQHEGQELPAFKNVELIGQATELTGEADLKKGIDLLSARNPRFKQRVEKGELANTAIFKITAKEIKFLDYSKGFGQEGITVLKL